MTAVAAACLVALALADPAQAKGTAIEVSITGPGLDAPLTIREPDKLHALELLVQPYTDTPASGPPDRPGPAYLLVFAYHNAKHHTVVLYPYASTGPFMELRGGPPDVPLPAGWYRAWSSAVKPMREAGVPLGPPPWEQTGETRAVQPIKRSTVVDAQLTIVSGAGALLILMLTVYSARRKIVAWQRCRSRPSSY